MKDAYVCVCGWVGVGVFSASDIVSLAQDESETNLPAVGSFVFCHTSLSFGFAHAAKAGFFGFGCAANV